MPDGYDARQRPWFQDAVTAKGKLVVTTSYVSKTTGDYVIGFAKAVNENSGVIHFEVKLATIADITKSIKIGNQGYAFILDRNQTFLAHPTSAIGSEAKAVQYDGMFKADSGTLSYLAAADGKPKKLNFVTNPLTGRKISGSWYDSESTQKAAPIFNKTAIVLAIAILLSAIAVVIIVRSISAPLGRLMGSMKRIADGNLTEEVEVHSKDELAQLSESVNDMVRKLRQLIGEVVGSSHSVAAASQQISASTEEIAGGSAAQAHAAQTMQELFGELSSAIDSVARSAEEAAAASEETAATSQSLAQLAENLNNSISVFKV